MRPKLFLSLTKNDFKKMSAFAKKAGFDGIDYKAGIVDLYLFPKDVLSISKKTLPIRSIHQPGLLILHTPSFVFANMVKLAAFFPDVEISNHHLSGIKSLLFQDKNDSRLQAYVSLLKKAHIHTAFESNQVFPLMKFYPKPTYNPDSFEEFTSIHNLPITFDVSHVASHKRNIIDFFNKNYKRISMIHLSDFTKNTHHLPLGKGDLPIRQLLNAIRKTNWHNTIIFEIKSYPRGITSAQKLDFISESLQITKSILQ